MTEPERPNPENSENAPAPAPGDPRPQPAPTPPPPYEQPPLPGEAPQGAFPGATGDPCPPPSAAQPYGQGGYQPPQPYQQTYRQPQQPYPQTPPPGYPQPPYPPQQPAGQPGPYGQTPPPPYGGQPPYAPYPPQQPYPAQPPKPQKKVWPWLLGGCLVILLLGIGGCASCTALVALTDGGFGHPRYNDSYRDYGHDYGYGDRYGYDGYDPDEPAELLGTVTLQEIKDASAGLPSRIEGGRCTPGVYEVGAGKDLEPGRYFLEGSQTAESNYRAFDGEGGDAYRLDDSVVYFGNYLADLEAGDVIVFEAGEALRMYPAALADFQPAAPYPSGLYRVGTDLPAGRYAVTADDTAADAAQGDSAAYVMRDLEFDDDSIIATKYVIPGGSQSITVKDGDYLELYAATATPAS